jgi:methylmalonyl-CoA mutase
MKQNVSFSEFPELTEQEWLVQVTKDLKGKTFEEALFWQAEPGLTLKPFFNKKDVLPKSLIATHPNKDENNDWLLTERIVARDMTQANRDSLTALRHGVQKLIFESDFDEIELETVLQGVQTELIDLVFTSNSPLKLYQFLFSGKLKFTGGGFRYDPLGKLLLDGSFVNNSRDAELEKVNELFNQHQAKGNDFRLLTISSAKHVHNAAGGIINELAVSLAAGNEYLDFLTSQGKKVDEITPYMGFEFAIGNAYFPEIAKFRAFRLLWATIVQAYEPKAASEVHTYLEAETSQWSLSKFDEHNNLLRSTTQAMAAVIGGVDSLYVYPFDLVAEKKSVSSSWLARNISHIIREESGLHRVIDPSAGSGYMEGLTEEIASKAWAVFQEIEANGGYTMCMKKGLIQARVKNHASQVFEQIKDAKRVFVGVNKYAKEKLSFSELERKQVVGNYCEGLRLCYATENFS